MYSKKFFLMMILTVFLIAGCESSEVSLIKEATLGLDNTVTIGNALESYQNFKNGQWESFETERGAKVVSFTANYVNSALANDLLELNNSQASDNLSPFISQALTHELDKRKFNVKFEVQFTISADGKNFEVTYTGYDINSKSIKLTTQWAIERIYRNDPAIQFARDSEEFKELNYLKSKCIVETIAKLQPYILTTYDEISIYKNKGGVYRTQPAARMTLKDIEYDDAQKIMFANMQVEILDIDEYSNKSEIEEKTKNANVLQVLSLPVQAIEGLAFLDQEQTSGFGIKFAANKNISAAAVCSIRGNYAQNLNQEVVNFLMSKEN